MKLKVFFYCIFFALIFQRAVGQHTYTEPKSGVTYVTLPGRHFTSFPDSVRIELPDQKAVLIFQFKNISRETSFIEKFPGRLKEWVAQIGASSPSSALPHQVIIREKQNNDYEIHIVANSEQTTLIRTHEKVVTELLPPGWDLTIQLSTVNVHVYAQTFKDLEALSQQNLQPVQQALKEYFEGHSPAMTRKGLNSRLVLQGEKVTFQEHQRQTVGDFMDLNLLGGLGFIADKVYPELNPTVSLRFGDRFHRPNYKVSFIYNNLFFTERNSDGGFTTRPNSFVSVAWSKNLVFKKGDPIWIGLGAGLLVHRNGDYFKGQTAKFFISKDVGHFNLAPELYLTNDFKKALLGFRLSYSF